MMPRGSAGLSRLSGRGWWSSHSPPSRGSAECSLPVLSLTCSWGWVRPQSEQPTSNHVSAGNPPGALRQPSQSPLCGGPRLKCHPWPHPVTFPKGFSQALRKAETDFVQRLLSWEPPCTGAVGPLLTRRGVSLPLRVHCDMLPGWEQMRWVLNHRGRQKDDQDEGPYSGHACERAYFLTWVMDTRICFIIFSVNIHTFCILFWRHDRFFTHT